MVLFARLEEDSDHQKYTEAIKQLKQVPKDTIPFDMFVGICILDADQKNIIKPLYDKANTFLDLFNSIREHHKDTVCQVMQGWVNRFVIDWLFSGKDLTAPFWIIPSNRISEIRVSDWNVVSVDSVEMMVLNKEQQADGRGNGYLGSWDPDEESA